MKNSLLIALMGFTLFVAGCGQPPSGGTTAGTTTGTTTTTTTSSTTPSATPSDTTAAPAGEVVTLTEVNIQYTVPPGWKKVQPDGKLLSSPNDDLAIVFLPTEGENVDAVLKGIGEELGKTLQKVEVKDQKSEKNANGLEVHEVNGTAEDKGKPVAWSVYVAQVEGSKPLVVLEYGAADAYEKNKDSYQALDDSFKPVEGGAATTGGAATGGSEPGDASPDATDASPDATDASPDGDASASPDSSDTDQ